MANRIPVDEVLVVIALHLILDGGLQVADPFEGQLQICLKALIGCFQALNVHFLLSIGQGLRI